jgi:hypothetical protein
MNYPTGTAMIMKTFFLAESFYRYSVRSFRDHGILTDRYPNGVLVWR